MMKSYHEQNVKMHKANEDKIDKIGLKVDLLTARFTQMENEFKERCKAVDREESDERHTDQWQQFYNEFKQLHEEVSTLNHSQLSFDVKGLNPRFNEISSRFVDTDALKPMLRRNPARRRKGFGGKWTRLRENSKKFKRSARC